MKLKQVMPKSNMTKLKIVFDSNILDQLAKLYENNSDDFNLIVQKCELMNCDTLSRETKNTENSNSEQYKKNIEILNKFCITNNYVFAFRTKNSPQKENTYGYLTKNDLGTNKHVKMLNSKAYQTYKTIHPNGITEKRESDKQIALIACLHNADVLVTNDKDFYKHSKNTSTKTMKFDEFLEYLKNLDE